ncbi:uncharacterized protein LOC125120817 [Phacochoerus africanus]|uniref:uncharacterized protein LOC125120817 n=1 Tax=Phacochoerus africanus TaxID=41426 RepID=UPI001FD9D356|nr:uncharacterized protein LOC125120817 [Phacochoerus africanus]
MRSKQATPWMASTFCLLGFRLASLRQSNLDNVGHRMASKPELESDHTAVYDQADPFLAHLPGEDRKFDLVTNKERSTANSNCPSAERKLSGSFAEKGRGQRVGVRAGVTRPSLWPQSLPHRWVASVSPSPSFPIPQSSATTNGVSLPLARALGTLGGLKEAGNSLSHNNTQEQQPRPLAPAHSRGRLQHSGRARRLRQRARKAQGTPAQQPAPRRRRPSAWQSHPRPAPDSANCSHYPLPGFEVQHYYHLPVSGTGTPAVPPGGSAPQNTDSC